MSSLKKAIQELSKGKIKWSSTRVVDGLERLMREQEAAEKKKQPKTDKPKETVFNQSVGSFLKRKAKKSELEKGNDEIVSEAERAAALKGINKQVPSAGAGVSEVGYAVRRANQNKTSFPHKLRQFAEWGHNPFETDRNTRFAREHSKRVLGELKSQPKPNLPKAEMEKASDRPSNWQKEAKDKTVHSSKPVHMNGPTPMTHDKGVHTAHWSGRPGESTVGMQVRDKAAMMLSPRERHQQKLSELKSQPKPNLPKNEDMGTSDSMPGFQNVSTGMGKTLKEQFAKAAPMKKCGADLIKERLEAKRMAKKPL